MCAVATASWEPEMSDYIWTSIIALLLVIYLLHSLLRPEKY